MYPRMTVALWTVSEGQRQHNQSINHRPERDVNWLWMSIPNNQLFLMFVWMNPAPLFLFKMIEPDCLSCISSLSLAWPYFFNFLQFRRWNHLATPSDFSYRLWVSISPLCSRLIYLINFWRNCHKFSEKGILMTLLNPYVFFSTATRLTFVVLSEISQRRLDGLLFFL